MSIQNQLRRVLAPLYQKNPTIKHWLIATDTRVDRFRHSLARLVPQTIRPDPREIFVTLTSACNLRCIGCRYGRDFMPGERLSWPIVRDLLDDARDLGLHSVRLYGGEPLLHPDLERIVAHSVSLGLKTWLSTNGILLKKKIDGLYDAGLREISIGSYGFGQPYDSYVQRKASFEKMEAGIAYVRDRYGMEIRLSLGWVLMRPTCNLEAVHELWEFARRYNATIGVSLIHYSLPYFSEGPNGELQFSESDRGRIEEVITALVRLKGVQPELISQSTTSLRSIPDWLLKRSQMKIPCDRYRLIWVGADGTVQLCYVTFKLGNLREQRLRDILFSPEHRSAARSAFLLDCPNCHCSYDSRIEKHAPSRRLYSRPAEQ